MRTFKQTLAKFLVLCMVVGLLPAMAVVSSAEAAAPAANETYAVNIDAQPTAGGTVKVTYKVGSDVSAKWIEIQSGNSVPAGSSLTIVVTPADGYTLKSVTVNEESKTWVENTQGTGELVVTATADKKPTTIAVAFEASGGGDEPGPDEPGTPALDPATLSLTVGEEKTLTLKNPPADTDVTWGSDNDAVATVNGTSATAKVKGVTAGSTKVYAIANDTRYECAVTVNAGGSSGGGGGGGGGGSSSSEATVKDPATSGGNTVVSVDVKPSTSGSTSVANVSSSHMSDAVAKAVKAAADSGTTPVVVINIDTPANVTGLRANLPTSAMTALVESSGSLMITSGVADIVLDAQATAALVAQAGADATITVAPVAVSTLSAAQQQAVGTATVIDFSITSGGKAITSFNGGELALSMPYALPAGISANQVMVFYLTDGGSLQACDTYYDTGDGTVTFVTTHLSKYVIGDVSMNSMPFVDVPNGAYYYDAVVWAVKKGVTTGTGADTFSPDNACTRAQIVTFLWRANGSPAPASSVNPFTDVDASAYYYNAVLWAVEKELIHGMGDDMLSARGGAVRAQASAILNAFCTNVVT